MTKGNNAKYILCHSGTSESEVIESKKKRDLSATLKMTVYSHSERSGNEVEESKSKKRAKGTCSF